MEFDESGTASAVLATGEETLDAPGVAAIRVPLPEEPFAGFERLTVEAGVVDPSGDTVYGRAWSLYTPASVVPGVSAPERVVRAGEQALDPRDRASRRHRARRAGHADHRHRRAPRMALGAQAPRRRAHRLRGRGRRQRGGLARDRLRPGAGRSQLGRDGAGRLPSHRRSARSPGTARPLHGELLRERGPRAARGGALGRGSLPGDHHRQGELSPRRDRARPRHPRRSARGARSSRSSARASWSRASWTWVRARSSSTCR